jgi:hypothetical protein
MVHKISKMDILIHILLNLPEEYDTTLELHEYGLENNFTLLERAKEKPRAKFDKIHRQKGFPEGALTVIVIKT